MKRLLAVFIASVIPKPNIVALIDQQKGQASLLLRNAHPNLAIHHEAMMQVHDLLLHASRAAVDTLVLLAFAPSESVDSQKEPIFRLHYMLFG